MSDQWEAEVMKDSTELDEVQRNEKEVLWIPCETIGYIMVHVMVASNIHVTS